MASCAAATLSRLLAHQPHRCDAEVFVAYGWPHNLNDEEILERLIALNHERAEEEKHGLIRWLRPDFQSPGGQKQTRLDIGEEPEEPKTRGKAKAKPVVKIATQPWPKTLPERVGRVRETLAAFAGPASADAIASHFSRAPKAAVGELLDTLVTVGQAYSASERGLSRPKRKWIR